MFPIAFDRESKPGPVQLHLHIDRLFARRAQCAGFFLQPIRVETPRAGFEAQWKHHVRRWRRGYN